MKRNTEVKVIDKKVIEYVLTEQQEELKERVEEQLCHRKEERLVDLKSSQAQCVIGVRRSGKSTMCYQALQDSGLKYAYVDFDDERLEGMGSGQLNDVLEVLYMIYGNFDYLFLDEIQNVEGWHLFVNRMLRRKMKVVITGSNAKLLSGELATHLTGRSKEISLYPFSFEEFCTMKQVDMKRKTTKAEAFRRVAFDAYLKQGGFPELMSMEDGRAYVSGLVDNILKRDIEQRYNIAYKAAFEKMAHHLLNVSPTIVVIKDLAKLFQFKSEHTVRNYVEYLKQAYMLIGVQKYSQKSKVRAVQEKVYAVDVAMMSERENAFAGENLGHRLETIVLVHLMRRCKQEGLDIYYLNERYGECDFLVCKNNHVVQAIQVSYDISTAKTRKREINGLLLAARKTNCNNLLLLTDHEYGEEEAAGHLIKIQPVYDWSLELGT
ncbi:MAG: ATP-binding protein [Bacteroidaceae bacterium]|nr:ATP-binding protein [Bacteroidaceae bacterium]